MDPTLASHDWQPGVLLFAWSNLRTRNGAELDTAASAGSVSVRTPHVRLLILWICKLLYPIVGAPVARIIAAVLWTASAFTALACALKRALAAFLGWQGQRITRHKSFFGWWLVPDVRVWHVTIGAQRRLEPGFVHQFCAGPVKRFECVSAPVMPRLKDCLAIAGALILAGLAYRCARVIFVLFNHAARRARAISCRMDAAASYEEWVELASELDSVHGQRRDGQPQQDGRHGLFDEKLLNSKVAELESCRMRGNVESLMFSIRSDLFRDFGNITNRCVCQLAHDRAY